MNRLVEHYKKNVVKALMEKFNYSSPMQVPQLKKIVLNAGVGEAVTNIKAIQYAEYAMTQISGQKPVITKSKKSIAAFKLRENLPIGVMVTLRKERMYDFLDRLISVALPRVRDFRGTPRKGFDGRGNYSLGIKEQIVFPEINIDKLEVLKQEGFVEGYELEKEAEASKGTKGKKIGALKVFLKYYRSGKPVISMLRRISKSGRRVYSPSDKIPKISGGLGVVLLSTSQGVISDRDARKKKIGGEVLAYIS